MTAEQLADWQAYDSLEPIGGYREDYRFAQVCLMLHNLQQMQRGDGKFERAKLHDFMLWGPKKAKQPEQAEQSVEDMKAILGKIPGVRIKKRGK